MEKATETPTSHRPFSRTAMWLALTGTLFLLPLLGWILFGPPSIVPDPEVGGHLVEPPEEFLDEHFAVLVALPTAAGISFLVVAYFRQLSGPVEFEAFGLKFKGTGGPTILWVVCFLAMAGAVKLLW
ncbi:hypothetical protein [Rhizobium laguerreae]|uniref:hypothetical protein n=1 Tax=Rhizobium laguerreae TaxID=1076926 RepID=UPI001C90B0BA|nr:hypothetical protein [Rhizobium laguerreae]MBY3382191.1 hypothetical protein [Rhizobium laguerreae]